MNENILPKKIDINQKKPIVFLSITALVLIVIGYSTYFFSNFNYVLRHTLFFISIAITLAPIIIFTIYILFLHKNHKTTICVAISFVLIAFAQIFFYIIKIYQYRLIGSIVSILIIVTFILSAISALRGLSKKFFIIIASLFGLLQCVLFISFIIYATFFSISCDYQGPIIPLYSITVVCGVVGLKLFYIALLLFGLKNRIPAISTVFFKKEKKNAKKISPEQSLILLKDKLDLGKITEEEYKNQRADIISKL
jgi:uncharacterized membrane protein